MRRPNRSVDEQTAYELLNRVTEGCLAMIDTDGMPYVTPVNAVYCPEDHCLYFHCACEGKRYDALHARSEVCFVAAPDHEVIGPRFTTHYKSVMVRGQATYIEDADEKRRTLIYVTERLAPGELAKRPSVVDAYFANVAMVKISIESVTAKINHDA